ncbi:hypothetical protein V8E55_004155 [Tylopilus felleus]
MDDSCRIFYISEITRVILDHLTDDKRSILSLAYSSKAISGTALDYLWADMDSFSPFVPLLPKPVQEVWDLRFNVAVLPFIKCPSSEDWKVFDMYAHRVRRLRPREDYLDRALYQRLVSIRPGVDLFPRLLSLRCHLFNSLVPGLKIFPSSLRSLSLYPEHALVLDGRAELALRQAAHDAPFLEKLCILGVYRLHPETEPRPLDFKGLHTVHLVADMLRTADLQSFSRLLSTSPIINLGISLHSTTEVSFKLNETSLSPRVENISICCGPRRAADIISRISSPYLTSVIVEHRGHFASVSEYGLFFTILDQRHPPVLEARMGRVYINTRNECVRGFLATLEPLVRAGLGKLKVDMSLYGAWKIEEEIKKRLQPGAWPSLAYFEFNLTEA